MLKLFDCPLVKLYRNLDPLIFNMDLNLEFDVDVNTLFTDMTSGVDY